MWAAVWLVLSALVNLAVFRWFDVPSWQLWMHGLSDAALVLLSLPVVWWFAVRPLSRLREDRDSRDRALDVLDGIAHATRDAVFAKDTDGRYLFLNQAAAGMLGRTVEEAVGRRDDDLMPAEQAAKVKADDRAVLADGELRDVVETVSGPAGDRRLRTRKGRLLDRYGRTVGIYGIARDVTGEELAAEQASRDRQHLEGVLNQQQTLIVRVDPANRITYQNEAYRRAYGFEIGDTFWAKVHPDDEARTQEAMKQLFVPPYTCAVEQRSEIHGQWRTILWQDSVIHDANGQVVEIQGVGFDVTERVQAEAALREHRGRLEREVVERTAELVQALGERQRSEAFLRMVTDELPYSVAYFGADGICRFANPRYAEWHGRSPAELVGLGAEAIVGPERYAANRHRVEQVLGGQVVRDEVATVDPQGGGPRHSVTHFVPHWEAGRVTGFLFVAYSVTEVRQAQLHAQELAAQLARERDRADLASRAKSSFLANMSHEIRTPLNAIVALSGLMVRDAEDNAQRERAERVTDASRVLLELVNDILDLSRIESGHVELADEAFSLQAICRRSAALVSEQARAKGIELSLRLQGLPDWVRGDPARLQQVLVNLLGNAVKFTERGTVAFGATAVAADDGKSADIRLEVADSGIGIALEDKARLFDPFVQADDSIARRFGGTGLGLAIARELIQAMGGRIGVDSQPGRGSRFSIELRLPIVADQATEALRRPGESRAAAELPPRLENPDQLRRHWAGARVLLAEDNPVNQDVIRELLDGCGIALTVVDDGVQAVEAAVRETFDLILMDMQMPRLDGLQAVRRLRNLPATRNTPILALTANAFEEDRKACLDAGMNDHVAKPIEPQLLYRQLDRYLNHPAPLWLSVAGIDARAAEDGFGGRPQAYARILGRFVAYYDGGLSGWNDLLTQGNRRELQDQSHSLRGAANAVAALGLAARAEEVERLAAEADPQALGAAIGRCSLELQNLTQAVRPLLAPHATEASAVPA